MSVTECDMSVTVICKRGKDSLHYTYLDTNGRPVLEIRNVGPMTEKHIEDFQLEFKFAR